MVEIILIHNSAPFTVPAQIAGMLKALVYVRATIQVSLIFLWTAFSGILGMILMLITRNGQWVHYVEGRYIFCSGGKPLEPMGMAFRPLAPVTRWMSGLSADLPGRMTLPP